MAPRVLVSEPLAARGLEAMTAAGLDVDVQAGLSPEELLAAVAGAAGARDPQRDPGDRRRARRGHAISSSSGGPESVSTTSTSTKRPAAA